LRMTFSPSGGNRSQAPLPQACPTRPQRYAPSSMGANWEVLNLGVLVAAAGRFTVPWERVRVPSLVSECVSRRPAPDPRGPGRSSQRRLQGRRVAQLRPLPWCLLRGVNGRSEVWNVLRRPLLVSRLRRSSGRGTVGSDTRIVPRLSARALFRLVRKSDL
jgi:hypothetical protein